MSFHGDTGCGHTEKLKCDIFSVGILLQKQTQEGIAPLSQSQEPLKPQEDISQPIHHPLILKTNFEEEEEEGDVSFSAVALCLPYLHLPSPNKQASKQANKDDLKCESVPEASHLKTHNV